MPTLRTAEQSHATKGLLRLTMACNERCPFCNVPMEDYRPVTPPSAQTDAELDAFVATGAQTLTISGGEPTLLRDRLLALIRQTRARGVPLVELQTNAILVDHAYAAALADAGLTSAFVSLLSHVPEHHDALAGLEGAFPRCVAGIDALLAHGIRVALNPVTAAATQDLLPAYVAFVAERLPGVRSISVSAVQPHGRAATALHLLPDYAVLARVIPRARLVAEAHGIALVNPYCGLPLCIGWHDAQDASVEAIEARERRWDGPQGVDNIGDKRHGAPCRTCAVRTRCGGAWHAYWRVRGGSGIAAPVTVVEPWIGPGDQTVVSAPEGLTDVHARDLAGAATATVWLWTRRLAEPARLLRTGCTDVALEVSPGDPHLPSLRALATLHRLQRGHPDQRRIRTWLGVRVDGHSPRDLHPLLDVAERVDASLTLLGTDRAPWDLFLRAGDLRLPGRVRWGGSGRTLS